MLPVGRIGAFKKNICCVPSIVRCVPCGFHSRNNLINHFSKGRIGEV